VNALTLAAKLINLPPTARALARDHRRPRRLHPSRSHGRHSRRRRTLVHPARFELAGLEAHGEALRAAVDAIAKLEPRAKLACTITHQYRNMRYWLEKEMRPAELALEAVRRAGVTRLRSPSAAAPMGRS